MADYKTITPEYFTAYMMQKGWSYNAAVGMANNIKEESNFGYNRYQGDKVVPLYTPSTGYGLAQWTSHDRKQKFKSLFGFELDKSTPENQMDFLDWELRNTEKSAGTALTHSSTVEDASKVFTTQYERPDNKEEKATTRLNALDKLTARLGDIFTDDSPINQALSNIRKGKDSTYADNQTKVDALNKADNSTGFFDSLSPSKFFDKYWYAGILIVGSIALIMAGGYMKGATNMIKGK
jgi:hypothetical protein